MNERSARRLRVPAREGGARPTTYAAVILGLDGGVLALYGSFLPIFPVIVDEKIPDVAALIGVVAIVTAVGVRRLRPWARKLGAGLLLGFLARDLTFAVVHLTSGAAYEPTAWVGDTAWIAVDAVALWVLARRWPVTSPLVAASDLALHSPGQLPAGGHTWRSPTFD